MSIITAYKSDADNKLFENKKKYQLHLRKLATARRYEKKVHIAKENKLAFLRDNFWNKVQSLAQLEKAILMHAEFLGFNGLSNESFYGRKRPNGPPLIKKLKEFRFNYSPFVSNSHSCPHNGEINWCHQDKTRPVGYPGFKGRIDYSVEWYSAWSGRYPGGSDMWKGTRIHIGGGGGGWVSLYTNSKDKGLQNFGYSFEIFLEDWPGLKDGYEKAVVWQTLNHSKESIEEVMNILFPAEDYK